MFDSVLQNRYRFMNAETIIVDQKRCRVYGEDQSHYLHAFHISHSLERHDGTIRIHKPHIMAVVTPMVYVQLFHRLHL